MSRIDVALESLTAALGKDPSAQYLKMHRARYVSDLVKLERTYKGGPMLELGALPCHLTYCLKHLGYPQLGVDITPQRMEAFIRQTELQIVQCDIERERLPFPDDHFSLVLMNEIFEHLRIDPITTLREVRRVMAPLGQLHLTTPNLYSLSNLVSLARGRGILDPYVEFAKIHDIGHMGHVREYAAYEVTRFLERIGFKVEHLQYDAYGPSWRGRIADAALRVLPKLRPYLSLTAIKT